MPNKIIRLDENTISKISAGEVILRPSNVVKELIENSIDAESTFIELEIKKGGKEFIRVSDNGHGITKEDLPLSIERFTTSKIKRIDDLSRVTTMGFRGEALASIAAVSRLTIISSDGKEAYKMEVENSKVKLVTEIGASKGTTVIVYDLFYNLPVRKKFLRTDSTELASISDTFLRYVISHPNIHFKMLSNNRILEEHFPQKEHLFRVLSTFKDCPKDEMHELNIKSNYLTIKLIGSLKNYSRNDNKYIYTYVNGRFINDRVLKKAIVDAYSNILPPQKYPAVVLLVEIDPREIDINIHPQKTEIRFKDPNLVYNEIYNTLLSVLNTQSFHINKNQNLGTIKMQGNILTLGEKSELYHNKTLEIYQTNDNKRMAKVENMFKSIGFFSSLQLLGQLANRFIVLGSQNSLIIVDQHAAQERILYNNLMKNAMREKPLIQRMLLPISVKMNTALIERLKLALPTLNKLGFDIEIFSDNTAIIKGIPALINLPFSDEVFLRIISSIDEEIGKLDTEEVISEVVAKTACHTSIRGQKTLNEIEIRRLLIDMDNTDFSIACPHGRPVYIEIKIDEIEKRLERR
ncbi:MAG: DNA mismatch repair endonuclease MutL [Deltaproteobacteria bacterium]|nr:DNA mismatch repair endonuclease MutL [Deltaproteobacteria bacterium]